MQEENHNAMSVQENIFYICAFYINLTTNVFILVFCTYTHF